MQKDFDRWNKKKKLVQATHSNKFCRERQIWWCTLGLNIGFEQDGTGGDYERPVLILKGLSVQTCLVVPLTTSQHVHPMRILIGQIEGQAASVIMSQIRVIDTKRLTNRIGYADKKIFQSIRKAVRNLI